MKIPIIPRAIINEVARGYKLQGASFDGEVKDFLQRQPEAAKVAIEMCAGNDFSAYLVQLGMILVIQWLERMEELKPGAGLEGSGD